MSLFNILTHFQNTIIFCVLQAFLIYSYIQVKLFLGVLASNFCSFWNFKKDTLEKSMLYRRLQLNIHFSLLFVFRYLPNLKMQKSDDVFKVPKVQKKRAISLYCNETLEELDDKYMCIWIQNYIIGLYTGMELFIMVTLYMLF